MLEGPKRKFSVCDKGEDDLTKNEVDQKPKTTKSEDYQKIKTKKSIPKK